MFNLNMPVDYFLTEILTEPTTTTEATTSTTPTTTTTPTTPSTSTAPTTTSTFAPTTIAGGNQKLISCFSECMLLNLLTLKPTT